MTNYERICADKALCAWLLVSASKDGSLCALEWERWLDAEQRELTDETEATHDNQSGL